ncbi:MAG: RNA polymerase sigma factor (sigma-70 family) [Pseudohongiellaceae bacterium]|jgi:RNA polymerase sigma factor (sigma-70 family)
MSNPPEDTDDLRQQLLAYAARRLGPASERYLEHESRSSAVEERIGEGMQLEDAVLAQLHLAIGQNRRVADEFAAFFILDLMKLGKFSMSSSSKLRRFLDTGDLVLSVFGDLWDDLSALTFQSRNQFKQLFAQRMKWKAADQHRRLTSQRRREDCRVPQQPEDLDCAVDGSDATTKAIVAEEREQLILILLRLKERNRKILTLHLKGLSIEAIADEMSLSYEAARKALSRAIEQARKLAQAA